MTLFVFIGVITMMAIGVMFKRKPIAGSCGGLNNALKDEKGNCGVCGAQVNDECRKKIEKYADPSIEKDS